MDTGPQVTVANFEKLKRQRDDLLIAAKQLLPLLPKENEPATELGVAAVTLRRAVTNAEF